MPFIIDIDHMPEPGARPGTNANAVGVRGPRRYQGDGSELAQAFRLLDDDRNVYYEGRSDDASSFEPLECFGAPNAGCTTIQYRERGRWTDL